MKKLITFALLATVFTTGIASACVRNGADRDLCQDKPVHQIVRSWEKPWKDLGTGPCFPGCDNPLEQIGTLVDLKDGDSTFFLKSGLDKDLSCIDPTDGTGTIHEVPTIKPTIPRPIFSTYRDVACKERSSDDQPSDNDPLVPDTLPEIPSLPDKPGLIWV